MAPRKFFYGDLFFNITPLISYFYLCGSGTVFGIRIWINQVPEYGSNLDLEQLCKIPLYKT